MSGYEGQKQIDLIKLVKGVKANTFKNASDGVWKSAGTKATQIGNDLERLLKELTDPHKPGAWHGDAADAFVEEVTKVAKFAKDMGSYMHSESEKSQSQVLAKASEDVPHQQTESACPLIPWGNSKYHEHAVRDPYIGLYHSWNNSWYTFGANETDHSYFAYSKKTSGDRGYMHGEDEARDGRVSSDEKGQDDWKAFLNRFGGWEDKGDGNETVWPKTDGSFDWDAMYEEWQVNTNEKRKCGTAADNLDGMFKDMEFKKPPDTPQFKFSPNAGQHGGGGGGGGGAMPGGGGGGMPGGDIPGGGGDIPGGHGDIPGGNGDIPGKDNLPHGPGGTDFPGTDSDGDGIPDSSDPFPHDPDHNHDGIPDGSGGSGGIGDLDTGTETARVGPGGVGGLGGGGLGGGGLGGGGLDGGPGGGGPGSGGAPTGAGTAGAGVIGGSGGPGGAFGSGAGGAGAGMRGGGMMPMMGAGGMGGEGGGQEQERNTWLDEDEDVWGADGDAPPSVIGG